MLDKGSDCLVGFSVVDHKIAEHGREFSSHKFKEEVICVMRCAHAFSLVTLCDSVDHMSPECGQMSVRLETD